VTTTNASPTITGSRKARLVGMRSRGPSWRKVVATITAQPITPAQMTGPVIRHAYELIHAARCPMICLTRHGRQSASTT
jgi:hypothetical protein